MIGVSAMDGRQERGMQIAATKKIKLTRVGYIVPSQTGRGSYVVNVDNNQPFCTCPDFEERQERCKHIWAVEYSTKREQNPDGSVTETHTVKVTYGQDWANYNAAQLNEQHWFGTLLKALCAGIQTPQRVGRGRQPFPLSDAVFAIVAKTYSMRSGRRFVNELHEARDKALVDKAASFTTLFRYLEKPEVTPLLKALIEEAATPLKGLETSFSVDSTGFGTSTYAHWFDHKYGKNRKEQTWIKAHLMVGVSTNVVTSVEVTDGFANDSPYLPGLLGRTAERFNVVEVSADKGYISAKNLAAITTMGATPYIPFKENATGEGPELWRRLWAYYTFKRPEFLAHYHKRSNIESTNAMIKRKFGASVAARTTVAQQNEVLAKILCHNICVLISSMYELGVEPIFGTKEVGVP